MTYNNVSLVPSGAGPGETDYYMAGWYMALHLALLGEPVPCELVLRVVDVADATVPRIAALACGVTGPRSPTHSP
jgi:hypothetical protein